MASFQKPDPALQTGRPANPLLQRALEARQAGAWGTCKASLRKLLAEEPGNLQGWTELYEAAAHFQDFPEAGRAIVRVIEARERAGDHDRAITLVTDALRRLPDALPARFYFAAAQIYERRRSPQMAGEMLTRLLTSHPSDVLAVRALLKLAELHGDSGRFRECRWVCERALAHPLVTDEVRSQLEAKRAEVEFFAPASSDPPGFAVPLPPFPTSSVPVVPPLSSGEIAPPEPLFPGDVDLPPLPEIPEAALAPPAPEEVAPRAPRPAWLLPAAGAGGLALLVVVGLVLSSGKPAPEAPSRPEPLPVRAEPAAPVPAPAPTVPAASGPAAPVRVELQAAVREGHLIVQQSGAEVLHRTFDFGKKATGGSLEASLSLPSGTTDLRVLLISSDRSVNEEATWSGLLPESGGVLRVERSAGQKLEVRFAEAAPPRARKR